VCSSDLTSGPGARLLAGGLDLSRVAGARAGGHGVHCDPELGDEAVDLVADGGGVAAAEAVGPLVPRLSLGEAAGELVVGPLETGRLDTDAREDRLLVALGLGGSGRAGRLELARPARAHGGGGGGRGQQDDGQHQGARSHHVHGALLPRKPGPPALFTANLSVRGNYARLEATVKSVPAGRPGVSARPGVRQGAVSPRSRSHAVRVRPHEKLVTEDTRLP